MLIACGSLFSSGWNLFSASALVNKFVCWSVLMYGDWLTHDTVCQCFGWLPLGGTSLYDQSPRYRVAFDPSPQQACHPCSQLKTRWLWKYFVHMAALHNETQMIFPMRKRRRNAATNEFKIIKLRNFWTGANPTSSQPLPREPDVTPDITISFQSCLSQSSPPTSLSLSKQFCQMSAANWVFFGAMHDLGHCHPAEICTMPSAQCDFWDFLFPPVATRGCSQNQCWKKVESVATLGLNHSQLILMTTIVIQMKQAVNLIRKGPSNDML